MIPALKYARLLCSLLSPRVCSNSCPLSWLCYSTISSSIIPFSSWTPVSYNAGRFFTNRAIREALVYLIAKWELLPWENTNGYYYLSHWWVFILDTVWERLRIACESFLAPFVSMIRFPHSSIILINYQALMKSLEDSMIFKKWR